MYNVLGNKPTLAELRQLWSEYPQGTRVECVYCNDWLAPIDSGTQGTVRCVDDMGTIHVDWDNGRCLGFVFNEDILKKI